MLSYCLLCHEELACPLRKKQNLFVIPCIFLSPLAYPFHTAAQTCSSCIPALASSFIFRSCYARTTSWHTPTPSNSKYFFARLILKKYFLRKDRTHQFYIRISLYYCMCWRKKEVLLSFTVKPAFCGDKAYTSLKHTSDYSLREVTLVKCGRDWFPTFNETNWLHRTPLLSLEIEEPLYQTDKLPGRDKDPGFSRSIGFLSGHQITLMRTANYFKVCSHT